MLQCNKSLKGTFETMSRTAKFAAFSLLFALAVSPAYAFPGATAGQPAAAPAAQQQLATAKGKIVETMDVGSYTYVCVENEGQKQWAAIPTTQVKVGDAVELQPGMVMKNFSSKSLNRTFDTIIFSQGLVK